MIAIISAILLKKWWKMSLTQNSITYIKCPHCKAALNPFNWISMPAFPLTYNIETEYPSCKNEICVKVCINFENLSKNEDKQ